MFFTFRCRQCNSIYPFKSETLYSLWKRGYDRTQSTKEKKEYTFFVELTCTECGNVEVFDTPTFRYAFKIIFDELLRENKK